MIVRIYIYISIYIIWPYHTRAGCASQPWKEVSGQSSTLATGSPLDSPNNHQKLTAGNGGALCKRLPIKKHHWPQIPALQFQGCINFFSLAMLFNSNINPLQMDPLEDSTCPKSVVPLWYVNCYSNLKPWTDMWFTCGPLIHRFTAWGAQSVPLPGLLSNIHPVPRSRLSMWGIRGRWIYDII